MSGDRKPNNYYDIGKATKGNCLLWVYTRLGGYDEKEGHQHRVLWTKIEELGHLAFGRISGGQGSVMWADAGNDSRIQRIICSELKSKHPYIEWWIFSAFYGSGDVESVDDFLKEE